MSKRPFSTRGSQLPVQFRSMACTSPLASLFRAWSMLGQWCRRNGPWFGKRVCILRRISEERFTCWASSHDMGLISAERHACCVDLLTNGSHLGLPRRCLSSNLVLDACSTLVVNNDGWGQRRLTSARLSPNVSCGRCISQRN